MLPRLDRVCPWQGSEVTASPLQGVVLAPARVIGRRALLDAQSDGRERQTAQHSLIAAATIRAKNISSQLQTMSCIWVFPTPAGRSCNERAPGLEGDAKSETADSLTAREMQHKHF